MFVLAEPCITDSFLNRPHLGCAMLISACREQGIAVKLITGQTRYLKDMFADESAELFELIKDLDKDSLQIPGMRDYRKRVIDKGCGHFRAELKCLYEQLFIKRTARGYFDAMAINEFSKLHHRFINVYFYYLIRRNYSGLAIIQNYLAEILRKRPACIGFSLQGDFDPLTRSLRKILRKKTDIPIIVGGALTPFIDRGRLKEIFDNECFDYLAIGAAERSLPRLIRAISRQRQPRGISNLAYREGANIRLNRLEVVENLDTLPFPDFSQFDLDSYLTPERILPLQTARGCSWRKCAFCSFHRINLGKHREISAPRVIETLHYLRRNYNCRFFSLNQEELSPTQAGEISRAIIQNGPGDIYIHTPARLEKEYDNTGLLRSMRRAGFIQIHWGMESASQRVLNSMNKGTTVKTMGRILKKSSLCGISNINFIFFGFPGESRKEAEATIRFLKEHREFIDYISPGKFELQEHSPLAQNPGKWKITRRADGTYSAEKGMPPEEVDKFYADFFERFWSLKTLKISSDKLSYYMFGGHHLPITYFLLQGHGLLTSGESAGLLKNNRLERIYPIIPGRIYRNGGKTVLFFFNIKESPMVNRILSQCCELDKVQEKIFLLSDGSRSLKEIVLEINRDRGKNKLPLPELDKKCRIFFEEIFSKNRGMAFLKPWLNESIKE